MKIGHIDPTKLKAVGDKVVGIGQELVGTLIGNERLEEAGEARQDKAGERLKALRKEIKAQKLEAEAELEERRQRTAERAKSAAN